MGTFNQRLPALRVHFMGWESDTFTLQRNGWEFAEEREPSRMCSYFMIRNEHLKLVGVSNEVMWRDVYHDIRDRSRYDVPTIYFNGIAHTRFNVVTMNKLRLESFEEVDMTPAYEEFEGIPDGIFRRRVQGEDDLFVEKADWSVIEMLEEIKRKQQPKQAEIRERLASTKHTQQTVGRVIQVAA